MRKATFQSGNCKTTIVQNNIQLLNEVEQNIVIFTSGEQINCFTIQFIISRPFPQLNTINRFQQNVPCLSNPVIGREDEVNCA